MRAKNIINKVLSIMISFTMVASSLNINTKLIFANNLNDGVGNVEASINTEEIFSESETLVEDIINEEDVKEDIIDNNIEDTIDNLGEEENNNITSDTDNDIDENKDIIDENIDVNYPKIEKRQDENINKEETVNEEDTVIQNDEYKYFLFDPSTNTIRGFSSPIVVENLFIPKQIRGVEVNNIAESAFDTLSFSTISFEEGINLKTIGREAFKGCTSLKSVTIPTSVEEIGENAFYECRNLEQVKFQPNNNLRTIGLNAFYGNEKVKFYGFELNTSLTTIEKELFCNISRFVTADGEENKLIIPANLETIGEGAFRFSQDLQVVFQSNNHLKTVGKGAFKDSKNLKVYSFDINKELKTVCEEAFYGVDTFITSAGEENKLIIPANLETIEKGAFRECRNIVTLQFEDNSIIKTISPIAFYYCSNLTNVDFGKNSVLESVESSSFVGTNITEIHFGSKIKNIEGVKTYIIEKIIIDRSKADESQISGLPENGYYGYYYWWRKFDERPVIVMWQDTIQTEDGFVFDKYDGNIQRYLGNEQNLTIPRQIENIDVKSMNSGVFYGKKLKDLTFEDNCAIERIKYFTFLTCNVERINFGNNCGIKYIDKDAASYYHSYGNHYENTYLKEVIFGENSQLEEVGARAFYGCYNLVNVDFGKNSNLREVKELAFEGTAMKTLILPEKLEKIGASAFSSYNPKDVKIKSKVISTIEQNAFWNVTRVYLTEKEEDSISGAKWGAKKVFWKGTYSNDEFIYNYKGQILEYIGSSLDVVIPSSLTPSLDEVENPTPIEIVEIAQNAFVGAEKQYQIKSVTIPNTVKEIKHSAFYDCKQLEKVIFEENSNLQLIDDEAFYNTSIQSITIPKNVLKIGESAFSKVNALQELTFEEDSKIQEIGKEAFYSTRIGNLVIPKSLTKIGESAFKYSVKNITFEEDSQLEIIEKEAFYSSQIKEIEIPKSVTEIKESAFESCYYLEKVTFEANSNLQKIGTKGFYAIKNLKSIEMPKSLKEIGGNCFAYTNLETITFEEGSTLEKIDGGVFLNSKIKEIKIPKSVTEIGDSSFYQTPLEKITFEEGINLQEISSSCFRDSNLKEVEIPKSVTKIGSFAFSKTHIKEVQLSEGLIEISNEAFEYTNLSKVSIPSTVTKIGNYAFYSCEDLEEVIFETKDSESQIQEIGRKVFIYTKLKNLYIPSAKLSSVADEAFTGLDAVFLPYKPKYSILNYRKWDVPVIHWKDTYLDSSGKYIYDMEGNIIRYIGNEKEVFLPKQLQDKNNEHIIEVKYLAQNAFENNKDLQTITISNTVQTIEYGVFSGCSALENVLFEEDSVLKTIEKAAFDLTKIKEITIPKSVEDISLAFCMTKDFWRPYSNYYIEIETVIFEEGSRIKEIGSRAFSDNPNLKQVLNIPEGVKKIDTSAFEGCINLKKVELPETLEEIGSSSFEKCGELVDINFPSSLKYISAEAFLECKKLDNVHLQNVLVIGEKAFYNCESLTNLTLSKNLEAIYRYAFVNDKALLSADMPDTLTYLGSGAFINCESLKSVKIPTGLESLLDSTFAGCSGLEEIYIPRNIKKMEYGVFSSCTNLKSVEFEDSFDKFGAVPGESAQIKKLRWRTFAGTNITNIVLPSTIEEIEDDVFSDKTVDIRIPQRRQIKDGKTLNPIIKNSAKWGASKLKEVSFLNEFIIITVDKNSIERLSPTEFNFNVYFNGYGLTIENISYNDNEPKTIYNSDMAQFTFGVDDPTMKMNSILDISNRQTFKSVGVFENLDNDNTGDDNRVRKTFAYSTKLDNFISYVDVDDNGYFSHIYEDKDNDGKNDFFDSKRYEKGEIAQVVSKIPQKDGYVFLGWSKSQPNQRIIRQLNVDYLPSDSIKMVDNVVLYPVWKEIGTYTLTLDYGEEYGSLEHLQSDNKGMVDLTSYLKPSLKYYNFDGWYLDKDFNQKIKLQSNTNNLYIRDNTTIYAKWTEKNVTIKYDTDGGKILDLPKNSEGKYVDSSLIYRQPSYDFKTPEKEGYKFEGWYTLVDDEEQLILDINQTWSILNPDTMTLELFAKWGKLEDGSNNNNNNNGQDNTSKDDNNTDNTTKDDNKTDNETSDNNNKENTTEETIENTTNDKITGDKPTNDKEDTSKKEDKPTNDKDNSRLEDSSKNETDNSGTEDNSKNETDNSGTEDNSKNETDNSSTEDSSKNETGNSGADNNTTNDKDTSKKEDSTNNNQKTPSIIGNSTDNSNNNQNSGGNGNNIDLDNITKNNSNLENINHIYSFGNLENITLKDEQVAREAIDNIVIDTQYINDNSIDNILEDSSNHGKEIKERRLTEKPAFGFGLQGNISLLLILLLLLVLLILTYIIKKHIIDKEKELEEDNYDILK